MHAVLATAILSSNQLRNVLDLAAVGARKNISTAPSAPSGKALRQSGSYSGRTPLLLTSPPRDDFEEIALRATMITSVLAQILEQQPPTHDVVLHQRPKS